MSKSKTVWINWQGKRNGRKPVHITPEVTAGRIKEEVKSLSKDSVLALERADGPVILEDDHEVYHQVREGDNLWVTDQGVFGGL